MKFTKMQGCGNDYIYVSGFTEHFEKEEKEKMAVELSDRHFGIGSDGIIFINPSDIADFEMEMYNADGSRAEMCGNGIRCVGRFVYDHGLTDKTEFTVESFGAIKHLELTVDGGEVKSVRVDMGSPIFEADKVPVNLTDGQKAAAAVNAGKLRESFPMLPDDAAIQIPLDDVPDIGRTGETRDVGKTGEAGCAATCVSMGNPHAVIFTDDVKGLDLEAIGPKFENNTCFPARTNTEFVKVLSKDRVSMRVWERGSGETLACGTGCCATAVASILAGKTNDRVTVEVIGGEIVIEWDRQKNIIYMTGPAVTVFEGEISWQE